MSTASTRTQRPSILAFLKAPVAGTVKTRLAKEIGNEKALEAYRWLVERQLSDLPRDWNLEIHYAPSNSLQLMREWLGSERFYIPQCEGDLGKRLVHGIADCFKRGANTVHCIGGDCPTLGPTEFCLAERHLTEGTDLVYGPAFDGGYYLISLRKPAHEVFEGIPWSSEQTLTESLKKAEQHSYSFRLLPAHSDVDELTDWQKLRVDPI
ncbi:MAG: TIGR04282 family arsenosugar biosynthesis glycosyltransferase [Verrucomicrobiota bacterium]